MNAAGLIRLGRRGRWPLAALAFVVVALLARGDDPPDLLSFSERGTLVLQGHLSQVYSGSWNQAGPLQLLGARLLMLGSSTDRPLFGVEVVVDLALLWLLRTACRRSGITAPGQFALGALALAWLGPSGLWSGHPVEVAIPVLWLLAARFAAAGSWVRCGGVLGLSVLVAPWALLAIALPFIGRTRALASIAVAFVVTVGGYLPFVLSGHFDLFEHVWLINRHTLVHLLAPDEVQFSWRLRVVQAIAAAGGALVTIRYLRGLRSRRDALWLAPLVAVLVRILLDPVLFGYYWLPAGLLVVAAGAMGWASSRGEVLVLALLAYLTYFGAVGLAPAAFGLLALAVTAVAAVQTQWRVRGVDPRRVGVRRRLADMGHLPGQDISV